MFHTGWVVVAVEVPCRVNEMAWGPLRGTYMRLDWIMGRSWVDPMDNYWPLSLLMDNGPCSLAAKVSRSQNTDLPVGGKYVRSGHFAEIWVWV